MKLAVMGGKQGAACAAIGLVGAVIYLFAFPKGSISTLMHAVLDLPGPGAGIALIFGPFLTVVLVISSLLCRTEGGAVIASVTFAVGYALVVRLLELPTNPKGAFGGPLFIGAVVQSGIVAAAAMALGRRRLKIVWACLLAGTLANVALLVFYWIVVFPRTAGWVGWGDVPLLTALSVAGGLASGGTAWAISKLLTRALALKDLSI